MRELCVCDSHTDDTRLIRTKHKLGQHSQDQNTKLGPDFYLIDFYSKVEDTQHRGIS